jgi:hypothetical protein
MSAVSSPAREWQSHGGPRASSAGCAPTAFGVASPYTVSIVRRRIALEALNPKRIIACRHDGPDNIVANPRVRLMVAEISRAPVLEPHIILDVWSQPLMGHPYPMIRRMRYGPGSAWGAPRRLIKPKHPWTTDVIDKCFLAGSELFSSRARVTARRRAGLARPIDAPDRGGS